MTNIVVEEQSGENRIMFVANANNSYSEERDEGWEFVKGKENEVGEVVVFQLEIPMRVVSKRKPGPYSHALYPAATAPKSFYIGFH